MLFFLSSCNQPWSGGAAVETPGPMGQPKRVIQTPFAQVSATVEMPPPPATATAQPGAALHWWVGEEVPDGLRSQLRWPAGASQSSQPGQANLRVGYSPGGENTAQWVYVLVAPFPTITDEVSLAELRSGWKGGNAQVFGGSPLLVSPATRAAFSNVWGAPGQKGVKIVDEDELQTEAWKQKQAWAIVPFEAVNPRWKVLRVDGISPLDKGFDPAKYPLTIAFSLQGEAQILQLAQKLAPGLLPKTNRDPEKLTVVVMTGVTALVRGTAWMMERMGVTFPGKTVRDWLVEADITHISNEVAFNPKCPEPDPQDPNLRFCSDPKYIQLLDYVGADVIELTGNHLNDFGTDAVLYSIDLYKQRKWLYYGGGENSQNASQTATFTDHGNKIAFIGCNVAGPPSVWATSSKPGAAKCDMDGMAGEIKRLKSQGFLVIATFQYYELYDATPLPIHYKDFRMISDAGATIVSGSQAHLPQGMELRDNRFIHYGLGNLFFDQMETFWPETRNAFIDRHVFYAGRYLGVELLTTRLEDYTRPRPMTPAERAKELRMIFDVSNWKLDAKLEWR